MARQMVEAGVNLVQVHLGNDETWDTHSEAFPHLPTISFRRPIVRFRRCSTICTSGGCWIRR